MKKVILIGFCFALLLLFFVSGCQKEVEKENKIVCVLFDMSETTNQQQIRQTYLNKFKVILEKINHGDAIEAALITDKSISELNLSIEKSFEEFIPSTDNDMLLKAEEQKADSVLFYEKSILFAEADSILFRTPRKVMATEILSSLQVANRVLSAFPQKKKVLVIFSDMIEESTTANFARDNLSDVQVERIIAKHKQQGILPSLTGVKVYVAGAAHPDTERYNRIRNFWLKYFKETGANLEEHNYGAAFIRFEE